LDEKGMAGFYVNWEFDDMFSSMICEDHDLNKNGILEKSEVLSINAIICSYCFSLCIWRDPFRPTPSPKLLQDY
jgi:ABC-type uncharacterized transport system substrate-binding protein